MNEAKAHAIPIVAFNLSYNPAYQNGVILVNQFDYRQMAKEAIKLLNNYIPVKKTNAYSNISEYETETSIQKNFSTKCQQNKNNIQAKSVQTTHNNQTSPNKYINTKKFFII